MHTFSFLPAAGVRRCAHAIAFTFLAALSPAAFAVEPTEFSSAYLDGKEFHGVAYDRDGESPVGEYSIAFTATTFSFEDLVPPGETGSGDYTIVDGEIRVDGGAVVFSLLEATEDYLQVELNEEGETESSRWYFNETDADALLGTLPFVSPAWITIDGDFSDWSTVPVITADQPSGGVVDILTAQYALDAESLYFSVELDQDFSEILPSTDGSGRTRMLIVEFNERYGFGTQDGVYGWFDDDGSGSDIIAVGGDFRVDGPRLEGKVPLALIAGSRPEFLQVKAEMFAEDLADETTYDEITRLLQVAAAYPVEAVDYYGLAKFAYYEQTDAVAAPQALVDAPFEIEAFVEALAPHSVTGATIEFPDTSVHALERDGSFEVEWNAEGEFADQGSMDAAAPNGTYLFEIEVAGGTTHSVSLDLVGDAYPAAPRLTNFVASQSIDSAESFSLLWDAFAGAGPEDFVMVEIEDPVLDSTVYASEFLAGTSTSVEIPANALQPGRSYEARILFANVTDAQADSFSQREGFVAYASETAVGIGTATNPAPAGEWKLAEFAVPDAPNGYGTTYDLVFDEDAWFQIEGPLTAQIAPDGEVSGDVSMFTQVGHHGQLLFYETAAASAPEGYAILNRSEDIFLSPWGSDVTIAVKSPDAAVQSDFAGTWNFAALTAGTELAKTVYDNGLEAELTVTGPHTPIAQDGSQYLVDVQRNPASADTLSLTLDAAGNGGGESFLWQADGSLSFSAVPFPLFPNASRDFVFGVGAEDDEQGLLLGVRAPTNADSSWLVGQWRFNTVFVEAVGRQYWDAETEQTRWVVGDGELRQSQPGERLTFARLGGEVSGEVTTISPAYAEELGISASGVVEDEGDFYFMNASGDVIIRASETEEGWEVEIGIKVSDEIHPTRTLTASVNGAGEIEGFPAETVESGTGFSAEYIHGEIAVIRAETEGSFLGWSGDVPEGQDQADVLVLPMDQDRSVTAHFGPGSEPNPWDPVSDTDKDGMPDVLEALFAERDPNGVESGSPVQQEQTPEGPQFSFVVRDDFAWQWRVMFSFDLNTWAEAPGEIMTTQFPVSVDPPLTEVEVTWLGPEEKVFMRVEVVEPASE